MLTPEQIKGRIKNLAKENKADPRVLLRIYMMERFLERIATSSYVDSFIIKGGILVTSMVGVSMRSTMDIDSTIRNLNLTKEEIFNVISEISSIDLNDGIEFIVKEVLPIMDDMEYPGVRLTLDATLDKMITPIKLDISTGDVITPRAIEYSYKLLLENRDIKLWSYNLETILAEKLQTVLSRGVLNTRMRDFYDIYSLLSIYADKLDTLIFKKAFSATCKKRDTYFSNEQIIEILKVVKDDSVIKKLWISYQRKYLYAATISFEDIINGVNKLSENIIK